MTPIPKGSIVTILESDNSFQGMQGILDEDATEPTQEVAVEFGRDLQYMFGWNKERIATFPAEQLRHDADFTLENRANRCFGKDNWHTLYERSQPFDPAAGHDCERDACAAKAVRRIVINVWGCVLERDVCEPCAEQWHGKMVEDFPAKKKVA